VSKPTLPFLETMITQVCNLSCTGCTNYSDLQHDGYVPWSTGREWLTAWQKKIDIPDFGIMGGEPLINPEVTDWIFGARELMPDTQIRFTTNGLLLHKKYNIVSTLADIGNCVFKITVHRPDVQLEEIIQRIFNDYPWEPVTEYGINRWKTSNNFRFQINRPTVFTKSFKGTYANMQPHRNNPASAFDACCQKTCPLMHNGRIYKCSTSGLLVDTLERFGNPNIAEWTPYLQTGLGVDCNDNELTDFLNNFSKPNAMCSMCPTLDDVESVINHSDNISEKKIKWL
jgi:hypothetical protein